MARDVANINTRKPPVVDDDEVDISDVPTYLLKKQNDDTEERKFMRQTVLELRNDVALTSSTAPDARDRVTFKSTGELKQIVAHKQKYTPIVIGHRIVEESDDLHTAQEYREPDAVRVVYWFIF